jgi:hypothetical protein
MPTALQHPNRVVTYLVNKSVHLINVATPSVAMPEWFGFPDSVAAIAGNVLKQQVNAFEDFLVVRLPV